IRCGSFSFRFFLVRLRRPPSSPLFPYTTLFRSGAVGLAASGGLCRVVQPALKARAVAAAAVHSIRFRGILVCSVRLVGAMFAPVGPQPLFHIFTDKLADFLGGSDILQLAEFLEGLFFLRVNQQGESGGPVFLGHRYQRSCYVNPVNIAVNLYEHIMEWYCATHEIACS